MTELKTLKDLEHMEDLKHSDSKLVYSWKLRKEAIKHYKDHLEIKLSTNIRNDEDVRAAIMAEAEVRNFIIYFFNITEDDLK